MSWVDLATCTLTPTILRTAQQFATGVLLADWVRESNVLHGTVVRSEVLIDRYNATIASDSTAGTVLQMQRQNAHPTARKWAQRWRMKHGVAVGKLRVREPTGREEMHDKALPWEA